MSNVCDFEGILKTECDLQHLTSNWRIKNLDDFERDEVDVYLWRVGLLNMTEKGINICYFMNRCLLMFLRGEKVNVVQYWWHIVVKLKVIILQKAWRLKTKYINDVPGQLFCCQCKANFFLETDSLYWWSKQISICYRYWQWNHWMSNIKKNSPINWYFTLSAYTHLRKP